MALLPVKGAFNDTAHFRNQVFFHNVKVLLILDDSPVLSHEVSVCEIEGGNPTFVKSGFELFALFGFVIQRRHCY